MTILVAGGSGATGRHLVEQLRLRGSHVRIIVRSPDRLPEHFLNDDHISVVPASLLELSDTQLQEHVRGCTAVASCLGHNMTFQGLFGRPRRLVTDATRRLCTAIIASQPGETVRFVLMNTTGNRNRDLQEPISLSQKYVIGLLRVLLPPHVDNEQAADYLRTGIGQQHPQIQWVVVRPDTLLNQDAVTDYELHPSPIRSAIFDAGQTSRINVAQFMAKLILDDDTWKTWAGQMPVIYNKS